jgi:hypothetical protein
MIMAKSLKFVVEKNYKMAMVRKFNVVYDYFWMVKNLC